MKTMMNNKVYGVIGVMAKMANWNADFTGYPRTLEDDTIYGSGTTVKHAYRKYVEQMGLNILYTRSHQLTEKKVAIRKLNERFHQLYGMEPNDKEFEKTLKLLLSTHDVRQFGATFAVSNINTAVHGPVQIGFGTNKYEDSNIEVLKISSPFGNSGKNEDASAATLGTKVICDEAHYFYPLSVTPHQLNDFVEMGLAEPYSREDYEVLKQGLLHAVTNMNSTSKMGCENELLLLVETEDNLTTIPKLDDYIEFIKTPSGQRDVIRFNGMNTLNRIGVRSIEIFINSYTTELSLDEDSDKVVLKDLYTKEPIG